MSNYVHESKRRIPPGQSKMGKVTVSSCPVSSHHEPIKYILYKQVELVAIFICTQWYFPEGHNVIFRGLHVLLKADMF